MFPMTPPPMFGSKKGEDPPSQFFLEFSLKFALLVGLVGTPKSELENRCDTCDPPKPRSWEHESGHSKRFFMNLVFEAGQYLSRDGSGLLGLRFRIHTYGFIVCFGCWVRLRGLGFRITRGCMSSSSKFRRGTLFGDLTRDISGTMRGLWGSFLSS